MSNSVFQINAGDPMPLYAQLERAIRFAVAAGRLHVGDQLPTVRQLAVELRINANTVARVYAELERVGVVETRRGIGTFIRARDVAGSRRDRERELREVANRFLVEAETLGYTLDDVIAYLESKRKKEKK